MTATAIPAPITQPKRLALPFVALAILLVGGCLNGMMADIGESAQRDGWGAAVHLFGVSLFVPIIAAIGLWLMREQQSWPRYLFLAAPLYAILVSLPSSAASWAALALFAGLIAATTRGKTRLGAWLFVGLALSSLWIMIGFKFFVEPLTLLDSWLTFKLLGALGFVVERSGNILTQASGFSVVILADCSSFKGLPLALLSFIALAMFFGAELRDKRLWQTLALALVLAIVINILRLTLLSLSPELHASIHSDTGKGIYDMMLTFVILALTLRVSA